MSEIKKIGDLMPNLQKRVAETSAPHEIGDCFGVLQDLGVVKGRYGKGYWFSLLKASGVSHHVLTEELIPKMKETQQWLQKTKNSKLNAGAYLTNKFSQLAKQKKLSTQKH